MERSDFFQIMQIKEAMYTVYTFNQIYKYKLVSVNDIRHINISAHEQLSHVSKSLIFLHCLSTQLLIILMYPKIYLKLKMYNHTAFIYEFLHCLQEDCIILAKEFLMYKRRLVTNFKSK